MGIPIYLEHVIDEFLKEHKIKKDLHVNFRVFAEDIFRLGLDAGKDEAIENIKQKLLSIAYNPD